MASPSYTTSSATDRPHAITPVVSVVMCTYNGERFLRPAIESILNQTFRDFELVVDDGSTDRTPRILAEFKARDTRVIVLTNERNLGIAAATNRGLAAARGEYIALQDHDDISLPHRFQTQVDFLNSHSEIALVGSDATLIDDNDCVRCTLTGGRTGSPLRRRCRRSSMSRVRQKLRLAVLWEAAVPILLSVLAGVSFLKKIDAAKLPAARD